MIVCSIMLNVIMRKGTKMCHAFKISNHYQERSNQCHTKENKVVSCQKGQSCIILKRSKQYHTKTAK